MAARRKRDFDLAMGMIQFVLFLIFIALFIPSFRQLLLQLGIVAIGLIAMAISVTAGIGIARRRDKPSDSSIANASRLPVALPSNCSLGIKSEEGTTPDLIEQLRNIDWFQFEKIVALAYRKIGYTVLTRGGANPDGGIDLIVELAGQKSSDARQLADKNGIELLNEDGLAKLLDSAGAKWDAEVQGILQDTRKFCPKCGAEMVLRTARQGSNAGQQFWGCSNYGVRNCHGTLTCQPRLQPSVAVALLCVALALQGCDRHAPQNAVASTPYGRAKETWAYWNALNKAAVAGDGIEVLQKYDWKGKVSDDDMAVVFRDIAQAELERCQNIESLPVLHVDPDLAAYGVQVVRAQTEIANLLSDGAEAIDQQKTITSGSDFAVGFGLQLLKHRNDDDGVVWNALMDQAEQTANDLQQMKPVSVNLRERALKVRASCAAIKAEEMSVRVKLSQRFNREFPTAESYAASKPVAKMEPLSKDQIIRDMIGWRINDWKFASPEEFVSLQVANVTNPSDVETDYDIQTHVKGWFSGDERDFRLRLTYGKWITRWKLTDIQLNN